MWLQCAVQDLLSFWSLKDSYSSVSSHEDVIIFLSMTQENLQQQTFPQKNEGNERFCLIVCLFSVVLLVFVCLLVGYFFCNEDFKISFDIHATYCYTLPQGIVYYIWRTADKYAKAFGFRKRGPLVKNCRELQ